MAASTSGSNLDNGRTYKTETGLLTSQGYPRWRIPTVDPVEFQTVAGCWLAPWLLAPVAD